MIRLAQGDKVKKVRIFRAWFSHGSGAILALKSFGIITEESVAFGSSRHSGSRPNGLGGRDTQE